MTSINRKIDHKDITSIEEILTPADMKAMSKFLRHETRKIRTVNVAESMPEFAERKRVLTAGVAARPGPYRYSSAPYLREPAENQSDMSDIVETVIMKAPQTGGTVGVMENAQLYSIEYGIGPVLYLSADETMAKLQKELRIDTMIESAGMQDKIIPSTVKKSNTATGDTKLMLSYGGTSLRVAGPNSEGPLRSIPARIVHIDEIDVFPQSLKEGGNTVDKAVRRADSYRNLKKVVYISTPKLKQTSRIEPLFKEGDMRYYNIACPHCGKLQPLVWGNFKWEKNAEGEVDIIIKNGKLKYDPTYYECDNPECGYHMHEYEKHEFMLEKDHGGLAEWIPTKEPDRPNIRSYHINALYGFRSWVDIAIQWRDAQEDRGKLQGFINDVLGNTWAEDIDKPDRHFLMSRAEEWEIGHIPEQVKMLTTATDVQGDRLEWSLMGWNENNEAWVLDYKVLSGNPENQESDCWKRLDEAITAEYKRSDGKILQPLVNFIDAGFLETRVVGFCDQYLYSKRTIKGVYPIVGKKKRKEDAFWKAYKGTIPAGRIEINDQKLKFMIYGNLKRKGFYENGFPRWYTHFPADLNEDYYKQLISEEIISEKNKYGVEELLIVNNKQRRNEALDLYKMNLAALYYAYIRHFEIKNEIRKKKRLKEEELDWQVFWKMFYDE